jgi:hypothetical protein
MELAGKNLMNEKVEVAGWGKLQINGYLFA